jgi:hypothetical protein
MKHHPAYQLCHTPSTRITTTIADTGASGHYLCTKDPYQTDGTTKSPIIVSLPNGASLQSTNKTCNLALPQLPQDAHPNKTCNLALPQLPQDARDAHILPGLTCTAPSSPSENNAMLDVQLPLTSTKSSYKKKITPFYKEHAIYERAFGDFHSPTSQQLKSQQPKPINKSTAQPKPINKSTAPTISLRSQPL